MSEQVKLHVVLPATESVGPFWIDAEARRPSGTAFSHLPAVSISAAPEETLRAVLARAGDLLGVGLLDSERAYRRLSPTQRRWFWRKAPDHRRVVSDPRNRDFAGRFEEHLRFAAFVRPGDEGAGPAVLRHKHLNLRRVATVDVEGLAHWDVHPLDAQIEDLLRAGDAGLVDGDPRRPYLILAVPAGDLGVFSTTWSALEEAFDVLWTAISVAGTGYSAAQSLQAIRDRFGKAKKVVKSCSGDWHRRGARPSDLPAVLASRPRTPAEVAALLGCAEAEAEALMWGLGFEQAEDARWRPGSADQEDLAFFPLARAILARQTSTTAEELRVEAEAALRCRKISRDPGGSDEGRSGDSRSTPGK